MKQSTTDYESPARIATYLEMEWSDWLLFSSAAEAAGLQPRPPSGPVIPTFYSEVVQFAANHVTSEKERVKVCDMGGATGRLLYEWLRRFPSVAEAVLVEPSEAFIDWSKKLLLSSESFEFVPTVNLYNSPDSRKPKRRPPAVSSFSATKLLIHRADSHSAPLPDAYFDIVTCLNVADRVPKPRELIRDLRRILTRDGALVLASPMDWRHNDTTPKEEWFNSLRELLPESEWDVFATTDIEYAVRLTNRQAIHYLSQVVIVRPAIEPAVGATSKK
jgi:SAM-dependent methyltransferase